MHLLSQEDQTYIYQIFNLTGQIIASGSTEEKQIINTSNLVTGIYILRISSEAKTDNQTIKIVVE
jgi:hypothetical protein